ncbi:ABC transporter ATP-binding protein [Phreatobacter oligotrophus]|uniref:Peptide/nickel transport system ATP-binding protein n=1 Tax=Phreatobacter oligotrophus TaxID=1122261 RepID=A0A2T4Z0Y6_9HYPH|nr:ABC transporter ATP-binding protein [Phreatobacter oligotrophus]PTM53383.1 peptide/nickel transport system ATP-binding protein [Phreatobacter oligotrophus]
MAIPPLVDIRDLHVTFTGGPKPIRAINGVDLTLDRGETLAILGESGSGKSVTLRAMLRLNPEKRTKVEGSITVGGKDVLALGSKDLQAFRGRDVSMIFQEPALALDPVYTLGHQIAETIVKHDGGSWDDARKRALDLFERVRIPSPERRLDNYPHEMSGGMRQRAMIALALACNPKVLLADEPTTALDATVQIQILLLVRELQREFGIAVMFVTHDIGVAVEVADRVAVMYGGRIVETGPIRDILNAPRHPYTIGLLKSRAHGAMTKGQRLDAIPGSPPDLANLPPGCSFAPRCKLALPACSEATPAPVDVGSGHMARCFRTEATAPAPVPA